MTAENVHCC